MKKTESKPPRRTQEERSSGTRKKVLDATTQCLIEHGYAGTTIARICESAGISQGGLFRHFPTREAVMVEVAQDVGQRLMEQYQAQFAPLKGKREALLPALTLLREACRSQINQAWFELVFAARTDAVLRKALKPVATRYFEDIERLARQLMPELSANAGDHFPLLMDTLLCVFDGEATHRFVFSRPALEDRRLPVMEGLMNLLAR